MFSKNEKTATVARPRSSSKTPTIISADLTIDGNIHSDGEIQLDGVVNGDIRCQQLTVGQEAQVDGEIAADTVQVRGKVTGRIHARLVELSRTARMLGDVWHTTMSIEAGAIMDGLCRHVDDHESLLAGTEGGAEGAAVVEIADVPSKVVAVPPPREAATEVATGEAEEVSGEPEQSERQEEDAPLSPAMAKRAELRRGSDDAKRRGLRPT